MKKTVFKTGLVLSGGGAKGAYHVGMIKALVELDIEVDIISGASIGALNGSILASSNSMHIGYERLQTVWGGMSNQSPLKINNIEFNAPAYLVLLSMFGLRLNTSGFPTILAKNIDKIINTKNGISIN